MEGQLATRSCTALPDVTSAAPPTGSERTEVRHELFSYRLLSPRAIGIADVALIGEAYRCWSESWTATLQELDGVDHVPSDEFTRQDEIGAIFHGYQCVALCCFRYVDLSSAMHQDDSYFRVWPFPARREACREGQRLCIAGHFTVAASWRRSSIKSSLKGVLTAVSLDRFAASTSDALVGVTRDDRGMSKATESLGANILGHSELHGVPVSLIAYYKSSTRPPLVAEDEVLVRSLGTAFRGRR
jgi:hypothetical protein